MIMIEKELEAKRQEAESLKQTQIDEIRLLNSFIERIV